MMAARAPKRCHESSQQGSPVPDSDVVPCDAGGAGKGPGASKSRKRGKKRLIAGDATLKSENFDAGLKGLPACKEENMEAEESCTLSRTVRDFLSAEFLKMAEDDDKFVFDILDVVRRAVATEIDAMSEEDVTSLTRERASKLVETVNAEVIDRYSRCKKSNIDTYYEKLSVKMDAHYMKATAKFREAAAKAEAELEKKMEESLKRYIAGVKAEAGKQRFTFRVFASQEFNKARDCLRDDFSALRNSILRRPSGRGARRGRGRGGRGRGAEAAARRRETLQQATAYVNNLEETESWAYFIGSHNRYAVRLPARPGTTAARLVSSHSRGGPAGGSNQPGSSGSQAGGSNQASGSGGQAGGSNQASGSGGQAGGSNQGSSGENQSEPGPSGSNGAGNGGESSSQSDADDSDPDRIFINYGWVIGEPPEGAEVEEREDYEEAVPESDNPDFALATEAQAESFSVVMSESDRRDIILMRRNNH